MTLFPKRLAIAGALAAASVFIAGSSQAFMGECYISLDTKSFEEQADKPKITVQDGVYHKPMEIDFQGKTLRTIKPGDTVESHGQKHVLLEVEQRANYSRYTFASQDDVQRYHTALSGEGVEQHVGVQDPGVQDDGVAKVGVQDDGVQHGDGGGEHK